MKDGEKIHKTWENGKKYLNLKIATYFSGGILIATGFIRSLYVHMGFGKPYQFEHVHELLFHEGTLTQETNHSEKAAAWRDRIVRHQDETQRRAQELRTAGLSEKEIAKKLGGEIPSIDEMMENIEWRFSLDYDNWF